MNATETQNALFGVIMERLHPEYARVSKERQNKLVEEVYNLVINEGLREVMNEIEFMDNYRPKKTRKAKE